METTIIMLVIGFALGYTIRLLQELSDDEFYQKRDDDWWMHL